VRSPSAPEHSVVQGKGLGPTDQELVEGGVVRTGDRDVTTPPEVRILERNDQDPVSVPVDGLEIHGPLERTHPAA